MRTTCADILVRKVSRKVTQCHFSPVQSFFVYSFQMPFKHVQYFTCLCLCMHTCVNLSMHELSYICTVPSPLHFMHLHPKSNDSTTLHMHTVRCSFYDLIEFAIGFVT